MPNIAVVLKEEISRLARKEVKAMMEAVKKSSSQHRKDIAALKGEVAGLERQVSSLRKRTLGGQAAVAISDADPGVRFTAKGLRSQRRRLGLSATDYAKLAGVSSLSIYNWEKGKIHPRRSQIANLGALRSMGKKEALARLGMISKPKPGPRSGSKNKAVSKKKAAAKVSKAKKK